MFSVFIHFSYINISIFKELINFKSIYTKEIDNEKRNPKKNIFNSIQSRNKLFFKLSN